jgi:hypothetical protein
VDFLLRRGGEEKNTPAFSHPSLKEGKKKHPGFQPPLFERGEEITPRLSATPLKKRGRNEIKQFYENRNCNTYLRQTNI